MIYKFKDYKKSEILRNHLNLGGENPNGERIDVKGDICFFMPFNMDIMGNTLEYATAEPLCKVGNTYFFAAIDGITPEYKFKNGQMFRSDDFEINGARVITLTYEQAKYARKLNGTLYIGNNCNLYEDSGEILCAEDGNYSYEMWNGNDFEKYEIKRDFENAVLTLEPLDKPPFELEPKYSYELHIGGERALTWKKLSVSSDKVFIEITDICDTAQIYADGELIADEFYYGAPWRIPAKLLYGKECYLVESEIRDDFYREF